MIYLKALVLERNGTISKKSECAQPYVRLFVSCRFYTALILSTIVASHELKSFRMVDVKINA